MTNNEHFESSAMQKDIEETQKNPTLRGDEEALPDWVSENLTKEVDDFLAQEEIQSEEELDRLLRKLDVAIAINGNPKAKELRALLLQRRNS